MDNSKDNRYVHVTEKNRSVLINSSKMFIVHCMKCRLFNANQDERTQFANYILTNQRLDTTY